MAKLKLSEVYEKIHNFKTKYNGGFTTSEVSEICKEFNVEPESLNEAIGCVTGIMEGKEFIIYTSDIYYGMKRVLGYYVSPEEWD